MHPTTSIYAKGGLVLHVFLDPQFIFEMVLCCPRLSVSPLWFRHPSRLIQIRTLAAPWRHLPSWPFWRDAGISTSISEHDIGWSPLQYAVNDILMSLNSRQNFLYMFCIVSVSEKVSLPLI